MTNKDKHKNRLKIKTDAFYKCKLCNKIFVGHGFLPHVRLKHADVYLNIMEEVLIE